MAANRLLQIITACALSFAATRTVCAVQVDCSIKVWKVNTSSTPHYSSIKSYHCTPQVPAVSVLTVLHLQWKKCPLSEINPSDSCGPVDPAPNDNHSHVAVVPCMNGCSLKEKEQILGQANYAVFIAWDSYNCSADLDLQRVSSNNASSVPLLVTEEDGQDLLLFSRNPSYVVDINIEYDGTVAFIGLVIVSLMLFCLCCCCSFIWLRMCWRMACRRHDPRRRNYSISKRTLNRLAVKCKYKADQSMNETCAICLEEFSEGEQVRELPCLHVYHRGCVETWLKDYKHTCPLCKGSITAKRKKRAAATKAERAPLLADREACVSYSASAVHGGRGDKEESNCGNEPVAITVRASQDAEAGLNSRSLY